MTLYKSNQDPNWEGNFMIMKVLKNKKTGEYQNVQHVYDKGKLIGLFDKDNIAYRWWIKVYIPSKRTVTCFPDHWDAVPGSSLD